MEDRMTYKHLMGLVNNFNLGMADHYLEAVKSGDSFAVQNSPLT